MTRADRGFAIVLLAATGLVLELPSAHAQSAEAEMLFRDGRKLIKDGKLAAGCDRLEASSRLEPSIGALLNVGDCREKLGKVASAWAAFRKAEAMAKRARNDAKREVEAARRAATLEPKLSYLVIDVWHRVDGLAVRRDGETIGAALWRTAIPLDPGSYKIVAEAPGYTPWSRDVVMSPQNKRQVVMVPQLVRAPVARTPEPSAWTMPRRFSVGLAIIGVGALGSGIYFGLRATDLRDQADARCPLTACGDPEALRLNRTAQDNATRANILYVAGGAVVATATVLWFVGRPGEARVIQPTFTEGHVGVSYGGSF